MPQFIKKTLRIPAWRRGLFFQQPSGMGPGPGLRNGRGLFSPCPRLHCWQSKNWQKILKELLNNTGSMRWTQPVLAAAKAQTHCELQATATTQTAERA